MRNGRFDVGSQFALILLGKFARMKSACIKVRTLSWLNGLIDGTKFKFEPFRGPNRPQAAKSNSSRLAIESHDVFVTIVLI